MTGKPQSCMDCTLYQKARMAVLTPALIERCERTGETFEQALDAYMVGVHARHTTNTLEED